MVLIWLLVCNCDLFDGMECGLVCVGGWLLRGWNCLCCNSCEGSCCNIVVYYDFGNDFFVLFLLLDLMYFLVLFDIEDELLEFVFWCKLDCIC